MANLVHQNEGTILTWKDSGGTYVMTLDFLASGAGRQGARHDFGVGARSPRFAWRLGVEFDSTTPPVVGDRLGIFAKTGSTDFMDNDDDDTGDAAVSAEDKLRNLSQIGSLYVDETAADVKMSKGGFIILPHRYFQPVVWNYTADSLDTTSNSSIFTLSPVPLEVQ